MRVEAQIATGGGDLLIGQPAGAFVIVAPLAATSFYLHFICPCGCAGFVAIPIATGPKQANKWQWDGNHERPTITPSIKRMDHCRWHGFLTAGVWEGVNEPR